MQTKYDNLNRANKESLVEQSKQIIFSRTMQRKYDKLNIANKESLVVQRR